MVALTVLLKRVTLFSGTNATERFGQDYVAGFRGSYQRGPCKMPRLTKRIIESAEIRDGDYFIFDSDLPGFGLRVMPSGKKTYVVQYRAGTRSRRMSLGPHGVLTQDQARTMAAKVLAAVKSGDDPAADRRADRAALTVRDLAQRFEEQHLAVRVKASSAATFRRALKAYILPTLGHLKITEVTRADVAKFHHNLHHIPYQANRTIEVLSNMFRLAEMWGLRPDGTNPCRNVERYREEKRERFLSPDELVRVGEVLRAMECEGVEKPAAMAAIKLLILTGCRLNEILTLRWDYVDAEASALRLPDSKTGPKVVHIGQPALDLLAKIPRVPGNPWVIVGATPGSHWVNLQYAWDRVRTRAGIPDVRIHDLRHSFASSAVAMGEGLPMIGKLLGHAHIQTTARYAHLAASPVIAAADKVSRNIAGLLG